jgi:hypothetical protein
MALLVKHTKTLEREVHSVFFYDTNHRNAVSRWFYDWILEL